MNEDKKPSFSEDIDLMISNLQELKSKVNSTFKELQEKSDSNTCPGIIEIELRDWIKFEFDGLHFR